MEETAFMFVNFQITEKNVKTDAIVRKTGLNIYVIFNNKNRTLKNIWKDKNVKKKRKRPPFSMKLIRFPLLSQWNKLLWIISCQLVLFVNKSEYNEKLLSTKNGHTL